MPGLLLITQASLAAIKFNRSSLLNGTGCDPWRQRTAIGIAPQGSPNHRTMATAGFFKGAPRGSGNVAAGQCSKPCTDWKKPQTLRGNRLSHQHMCCGGSAGATGCCRTQLHETPITGAWETTQLRAYLLPMGSVLSTGMA